MEKIVLDCERLLRGLEQLAVFRDPSLPGWTRSAFSPPHREARRWLADLMREAGLTPRLDAAANLVGRREGTGASAGVIAVGSHSDTVVGGGRFDGALGVLAAVEVARSLAGVPLRHDLEVIDFTAEEPTPWGISTVGSKAMAGNLTEQMLQLRGGQADTLADAVRQLGGDPERIDGARRSRGEIAMYLELHIEQGPVLEESGLELGAVSGIVGLQRMRVTVTGRPDHAGTTPMSVRRDALAGAAEIILALEELCRMPARQPLVGTVGAVSVEPNASNVVAGRVVLQAEVRSLEQALIEETCRRFRARCAEVADKRKLQAELQVLSRTPPVPVQAQVLATVREACRRVSARVTELPSGAGHDANQMAGLAPVGMIFVPSRGGRSHCPEEDTDPQALCMGARALLEAVLLFDRASWGPPRRFNGDCS